MELGLIVLYMGKLGHCCRTHTDTGVGTPQHTITCTHSPRCLSRALGFPNRLRPVLPFCFCLFLSLALPSSDAPLKEEAADSGSEASPPTPARLSPSTLRGPGFIRQWSSKERQK